MEARLQQLVEAGERVKLTRPASFEDEASRLSASRRAAWAGFLCSIATTESIEDELIEPLKDGATPGVLRYLEMHGEDERRHHALLTDYVRKTFGHVKSGKTTSDRIVYGWVVPGFSRLGRAKPLYLLSALRFYEAFSLEFYAELRRLALEDGLLQLAALVRMIEKDETRHLAGLEALAGALPRPSFADLLAIRSILAVFLFDIDIGKWAFHNGRVRRNAVAIGIDPERMGRDAREAARRTVAMARGGL